MIKKALHLAALFALALNSLALAPLPARAQQVASNSRPRTTAPGGTAGSPLLKRMALRAEETAEGTRVRVASDAPVDGYEAYAEGGRFVVLIPQASAAALPTEGLAGRGFESLTAEQRGHDAVLLFTPRQGFAPRVRASFNRLDVLFVAQQSGGSGAETAATATPTPSPVPAPPPSSTAAPADGDPSKAPLTPAVPTSEAAKSNLNPPATKAARLAALLTPEKANPVTIPKTEKAPVIDGKLDDEVWKSAAVFKDFIQYRPEDLVAPTKQTEAYITYDAKFLYVAFKAFDEKDKVRATVAKRDAVFDDDWVGIWLDTFNDGRRAYELIFNPLGIQADAIFTEGINEDFSVDIVHESKGSITDDGFVVEVAIPFKSLRYTAGKDKKWGLHLLRTIKRFNNEQSTWMPISKDNSSLLGQRGYITGLEGVSAERTLEIIPSFTASQTGQRVNRPIPGAPDARAFTPVDRMLNKPVEFDLGVTSKFTITPQITLDFTYNPDFAQVEADATVVTANQRFPIFFEEKRPFFLEGKEIFETQISAVHTRTIVDPDYAVKLTGKQGRNTFGVLLASDPNPGRLTDDELDFLKRTEGERGLSDSDRARRNALLGIFDKNATVGILRLKRDVGKESFIGFLGTSYDFLDRHNQVAGFDSRFRLNKTTTLSAQVLGSTTQAPFFFAEEARTDDRRVSGMAYSVYLNNSGRNWGYELGSTGRSRFFRADVGFNRRFDTNNPTFFARYNSDEKPKAAIVAWRVYNFMGSNFDWRGRGQRFVNESQLQLRMQRQTFIGIGFEKGFERVFEDEFGGTREAIGRQTVETFAPLIGREAASALSPCDPTGFTAPVIPDDPTTPDVNEERRLARCTFAGAATERRADRTNLYGYFETVPSKKYAFFMFTSYNWGVLDFDFGSGSPRYPRISPAALAARQVGRNAPQDPGAGNEFYWESTIRYKPTDAINLSLFYVKDRLTRSDTGRVAFDDNIFTLRGTYQFTRFWFARARVDYSTLASRVRMQYLLGWAPNPGTSFYAGYNDDLNRNGFSPFTGELEPGFRRNGRTFFIKASYLFRKSFGN
ncbi:MAG TPA: DUF5916 domain-containing protein [Pyrinomonadaceae bacterium]|nr:DUF5916 domain-containing protein [Pyrinomonadaceae bacterium]